MPVGVPTEPVLEEVAHVIGLHLNVEVLDVRRPLRIDGTAKTFPPT